MLKTALSLGAACLLLLSTAFASTEQDLARLRASGLSLGLVEHIRDTDKLMEQLEVVDWNIPRSWNDFVFEVLLSLSQKQRIDFGSTIYSDFYFASQSLQRESSSHDETSKTTTIQAIEPSFGLALNGRLFRFYQRYFSKIYHNIKDPLIDFKMPDPLSLHTYHENRGAEVYLTLYRGIQIPDGETHASMMEKFQGNGLLSAVARLVYRKSRDLNSAIESSNRQFHDRGVRTSLLEHLLDDWASESVFIATSIDPKVAEHYAGRNGIVLTLRVPASKAYFVNDPIFWMNTPWQTKGNPAGGHLEVVVANQVSPEEIVEWSVVEHYPETAIVADPRWLIVNHSKAIWFSLQQRTSKAVRKVCQASLELVVGRRRPQP